VFKMIELTVEEFESSMDSYMDRVEAGEQFLIRHPDGRAVVAVPAEELIQPDDKSEEVWYDEQCNHGDGS